MKLHNCAVNELVALRTRLQRLHESALLTLKENFVLLDAITNFGLELIAMGGVIHMMLRISALFQDGENGYARQLLRKCTQ